MTEPACTPYIGPYRRYSSPVAIGLICVGCNRNEAVPNSNYCSACFETMLDRADHWYRPSNEQERKGEEDMQNECRLFLYYQKLSSGYSPTVQFTKETSQ